MTSRRTPATTSAQAATHQGRTPPVSSQHLAELTWRILERAGEDVLVTKEAITTEIHATDSQFSRLKGHIRDHVTLEKGLAFLAFRGGYMITADPAKIAESVGWRLHCINTELRRLLSGWINPLGDQVANYEVLAMYQDEIGHMLRLEERMRKAALAMPKPVKGAGRRRRRARAATAPA
ncbi:hypothetical protein F4556_003750 [Kitasatospora gansuensis]|uniref:Uncharacterized protein n=1 Tax=Kitasatospora gansuensis TaxID=258050 RepID=A0A7W7SD19_9ACTN|nr:hypothetical protein [Kitasatospora gansuensis]MBB4948215.1 hypothetical protein [Kitasatospora gansuensis]